jgi:uncharacterized protein (TIRG00374 family)
VPMSAPETVIKTHLKGSGRRTRVLVFGKCVLAAILLGWIGHRIDLVHSLAAAASVSLSLLLLAYILDLVGCFRVARRWTVLLQVHGVSVPLTVLMKSVMVASFFNNFLPSTVGGDAIRVYDSYRLGQSKGAAVSAVLVDRLLGLVALSLLALCSLPFVPEFSGSRTLLVVMVVLLGTGFAAFTWAIFSECALLLASRLPICYIPAPLTGLFVRFWGALRVYRGQPMVLARALGLSLALQGSVVLADVLLAQSLRLPVAALSFCWIVPLTLFVTMVPVSINGIGLRENAMVLFLGMHGVTGTDAVAYAWLIYFGSLAWGVVGGVVYAFRR